LLLHLAAVELYKPKWTDTIQHEWIRNLVQNRPDITVAQLQKTVNSMNTAFPDANVERYEALVSSFTLPDPNDRHILAAAVRCQAELIVTSNTKDFPNNYLREFDIEAQHPDIFITNVIDLTPVESIRAFKQQVSFLKNPPKTYLQVLASLEKCGLPMTCKKLLASL
jgi:predicted nucleic acid-binding protein